MEVDADIFSDSAHSWTRPGAPTAERFIDSSDPVEAQPRAAEAIKVAPAPVSLHLRDDSAKCVCPPGTPRLAKDMVMTIDNDTSITWTHLPCRPHLVQPGLEYGPEHFPNGEQPLDRGPRLSTDVVENSGSGAKDLIEMFAGILGPNPTPEQHQMVKNITSTFRCDGPCPGEERSLDDFFLCKKCLSWQHRECQLYGDPRDRGGPVCNQCYIDLMMHREEIDKWQRRQLLRAVQEAVEYLKNPDTMHQTWRRKWCRDFVQSFLAKNKGHFITYLVKRKRQHTEQQTQLQQPQKIQSPPIDSAPARKRPKRKSTVRMTGGYNEFDEDSEEDRKGAILLAAEDDIIVAPRVKSEPKRKATKTDAPAIAPISKRAAGKRRKEPSPPPRNQGPRGPRKSVRMADHAALRNPFRDDDDTEDDEVPLPTIKTESRTTPPSSRPAPLTSPDIACACFSSRVATTLDSFECDACGLWQHKRCGKSAPFETYSLCNDCLNNSSPPLPSRQSKPSRKSQDRPKPKPKPVAALPSLPSLPPPPPPRNLDPALVGEIRTLSSTILWNEYISIPGPDDAGTATQPSTPPQEWLTEMESRLSTLLAHAGPQQMAIYLNPALGTFPRDTDMVLQALRDLAVWICSKGSLRGRRNQLGLLLEVLGLDDKGRHWQGVGS